MIYLDNASTTKCFEESAEIIKKALVEDYFNPSAKYANALNCYKKLDQARKELLQMVGARECDYQVVFTGSATESNNLVLTSSFSKHKLNLISAGEHSSVFETAKAFNQIYNTIKEIPLNVVGEVDIEKLKEMLTKDIQFVSVMMVSNETGAVNNIKEIARLIKSVNPKVLIHVDAVQGFMKLKINMTDWGVDYLTLSSHKVHGPKGVGALVYKKTSKLNPQILGGGQELGKRSGTENLPAILGFVNSAKILNSQIEENYEKVMKFKLELLEHINKKSQDAKLELVINGDKETASPYILSIGFVGTKGEVLLHALENEGILVGTGSACNAKHSGNRVLSNMGKSQRAIESNIRLSFSKETALTDPEKIAETIVTLAKKLNTKGKR